MSKIKITDFGPIKRGLTKNDGWLDVKGVTVFIGNQGSGKSTVAKVISTLAWIEKAINRGDLNVKEFTINSFTSYFQFQKIQNYFTSSTYIEYIGDKYHILFDASKKKLQFKEIENSQYIVPQIMYVPSERNFLSTISDAFNVKGLPDNVFAFAGELKRAQNEFKGKKIDLPINGYSYEYDSGEDSSYVSGDNYRIRLLEASSGLQSFIPLYLVTRNLSISINERQKKDSNEMSVTQAMRLANELKAILEDSKITEKEKAEKSAKIRSRYMNKCFINIVEEPEQNLFPHSQWNMLKCLLKYKNLNTGNKLLITTHSPYLVNYLSIAIQSDFLKGKIQSEQQKSRLEEIIPLNATVSPGDIGIYQFDEKTGEIKHLPDYEGIPTDKNYLNESLYQGNELFDKLLELEQEL
ncbi:MAG: ATP-binding protein [bacterium]